MQRITISVIGFFLAVTVCGCSHIDFGGADGRLTYYDPKPYLLVSITGDCVSTATVLVLPDEKKSLKLIPGYGSAELSVSLSNGMITSVGQKTDTKIPETIGAIAGLATAIGKVGPLGAEPGKKPQVKPPTCTPASTLFPIVNGKPDVTKPINLKIQQ